jgi:hypothetical protein
MKKRLIFILFGLSLFIFIAVQIAEYVKNQTVVLKKETTEKWALFSKSFDLLLIDLENLKKDSANMTTNDDLFKFLNKNIAHNSINNTDSFELFCYQLNKKHFQQVSDSNIQNNMAIQNRLSQLNALSLAYNDMAKKHNVFVGTVPNFYIIKENQRKRMPYFSVRFNQNNLDPALYKKRFNSYIETGQDRFLNEPNKN